MHDADSSERSSSLQSIADLFSSTHALFSAFSAQFEKKRAELNLAKDESEAATRSQTERDAATVKRERARAASLCKNSQAALANLRMKIARLDQNSRGGIDAS